jgi:hypothetical protein
MVPPVEAGRYPASASEPPTAGAAKPSKDNRRLFGLLFGINTLNYADRCTLPAVAATIAGVVALLGCRCVAADRAHMLQLLAQEG